MPQVHTVKKARKNYPDFDIKKGDSYFWWSFAFGPTVKSKTYPKRSQLTRSSFLSQLWDIEDGLGLDEDMKVEDLQSIIENFVSDLEQLKEECEESLENMPEHLQEASSSGELLTERIEGLESWISDLENLDYEEPVSDLIDEIEGFNPGL